MKPWAQSPVLDRAGVVLHTCDPSTGRWSLRPAQLGREGRKEVERALLNLNSGHLSSLCCTLADPTSVAEAMTTEGRSEVIWLLRFILPTGFSAIGLGKLS